jgi:hypothetical protein
MPVWDAGDEAVLPALMCRYRTEGWTQEQAQEDLEGAAGMVFCLLWAHRSGRWRQQYSFHRRYALYGPPCYGERYCVPYGVACQQYPCDRRLWLDDRDTYMLTQEWWLVRDAMEGDFLAPFRWIQRYRHRTTRPRGRRGWWWVPEGAPLAPQRTRAGRA